MLESIKLLGLSSGSQVTNVSVIDTASVPIAPSSPKKKLSLVLSGFLALMTGIGVAFVLERSDSGLKSADEVQQYLRLPSLATVLRFSGTRERGLAGKAAYSATQVQRKLERQVYRRCQAPRLGPGP